ncbi:MAG: hypothetical protein IID28_01725 [Planctomycetes bacterium]|nr:hypothetical protein [Planctomycetota bacterium]
MNTDRARGSSIIRTHALIAAVGAAVGLLAVFSIWFVPDEPYPSFIVAGGTLNGVVTGFLIAAFVDRATSVPRALVTGAVCGLAASVTVYLAKGGWISNDAPYVVPAGVAIGLILGPAVRALHPKRPPMATG